jgi:hypothetical protein
VDAPDAVRFGIPTANVIAFRAADLTVIPDAASGDARVIRGTRSRGVAHRNRAQRCDGKLTTCAVDRRSLRGSTW